jgi:hypothetical protein
MIENITIAAKMKALLAVAALLLVGGVFSTENALSPHDFPIGKL